MSMLVKNNLVAAPNVKILINVGCGLDVTTGFFVKGRYGEYILNGGLGFLTGMTGIGNSWKTTTLHHMMLCAASRVYSTTGECMMDTYDTEMNIHEQRLRQLSYSYDAFKERDILNDGTWTVTDKTIYPGEKWFDMKKEYIKDKIANAEKLMVETPFLNRDGVSRLKVIVPTFSQLDSISQLTTTDVDKMMNENEIGEAGGNTLYMRSGLAKNRLLAELPVLAAGGNNFTMITAHIGKEISMASGPYAPPPTKKLQHMNPGEKLKGVSDNFYYLTTAFWCTKSVTKMINRDSGGTLTPKYPRDSNDKDVSDCDLNLVSMILLRSKAGPSGIMLDIIVSQTEGVLPSLTEFHLLKENDNFGFEGNVQNYTLSIYPDCKLSRSVIRNKIDNDVKLRRALNITSELCQIRTHHRDFVIPSMKEIYEGVKANGYDWDFILENTRGWWTFNNEDHPLHFLCSLDLARMAKPKDNPDYYHPYWLESDCKTVKKEFIKA